MRKMILLSAVGAIAFGIASPASADQGDAGTPRRAESNTPAAADPNRRICVSEAISGSRMPRRVCRTVREWQQQEGEVPETR